MKFKHHLVRHYHLAKNAPLWKWVVVIFLVVAMPLFFSFVRMQQMQQVLGSENVREVKVEEKGHVNP
jgi:hypothetical protein